MRLSHLVVTILALVAGLALGAMYPSAVAKGSLGLVHTGT